MRRSLRAVAAVAASVLFVVAATVVPAPVVAGNDTEPGAATAGPTGDERPTLDNATDAPNDTGLVDGRSHERARKPTLLQLSAGQRRDASVGSTVRLTVSVEAVRTLEDVSVHLYDSADLSVTADAAPVDRLERGERRELSAQVTPERRIEAASTTVTVEVSGTVDGTPFTRRRAIPVATGGGMASTAATGERPEPSPAAPAVPVEPGSEGSVQVVGEVTARATDDTTARATDGTTGDDSSHVTSVTIEGRFAYEALVGGSPTLVPARQVTVQVWDADTESDDDLLAETTTDDSGSFSVGGIEPYTDQREDGESATADVYVRVLASNPAATVTQDDRDQYYTYFETVTDVEPGETYSYGRRRPSDRLEPAYEAADEALEAYRYVRDNTDGDTRQRVRIEYPAGDWPLYRYRYNPETGEMDRSFEHIRLPDRTTRYWSGSTVYHEYGHALMSPMYEWNVYERPRAGAYDCHYAFSETDPGFAAVEGWAEFVEGAVTGDPGVVYSAGGDLETNEWYDIDYDSGPCPGGDTGELDGNSVEGSFASALFDLVDTGHASDESLEEPFQDVFDTMADNNVQNGTDFVAAWRADGRGERDAVTRTFARYGVVEPVCERCGVATDVDGDDRYEDVDGNGDLTFFDVLTLYDYLQRSRTSPAVAPFDFDGDGQFTFFDVLALYDEFQSA